MCTGYAHHIILILSQFLKDFNMISVFISVVILSWFVGEEVADDVVRHSGTIDAKQVGQRTTTSAALGENVYLNTVRQYCDAAAWLAIESVVAGVKRDGTWYCAAAPSTLVRALFASVACNGIISGVYS